MVNINWNIICLWISHERIWGSLSSRYTNFLIIIIIIITMILVSSLLTHNSLLVKSTGSCHGAVQDIGVARGCNGTCTPQGGERKLWWSLFATQAAQYSIIQCNETERERERERERKREKNTHTNHGGRDLQGKVVSAPRQAEQVKFFEESLRGGGD